VGFNQNNGWAAWLLGSTTLIATLGPAPSSQVIIWQADVGGTETYGPLSFFNQPTRDAAVQLFETFVGPDHP